MMKRPIDYPEHRIADVGLRDGSTIGVRPVLPEDRYEVEDLFQRLSERSNRLRFHGKHHPTITEIERFVEVDYKQTFGLVAETSRGNEQQIVALASYFANPDGTAEFAIVVDDPFQGRGIGSILMEHLSEAAVEAGVTAFAADVLSGNSDMIEVLGGLDLPLANTLDGGVIHSLFPTAQTPASIEAFEQREAVAAVAAVSAFLHPSSVAVIGASRRRGTISGELFRNLLDGGFQGPVYPVNPNSDVVQSVAAYRSVLDIEGPVDLAVLVVPADAVIHAAKQCAEKGVRALLVISSGFAEAGPEGVERQRRLLEVARQTGMRIIGPNCMGIVNADPAVSLNATFAPSMPSHGRLAFSSQSGALGIAVMDKARELGLGMSSFVSVGNKSDLSGNDLLQYWEQDEATDVILLYLESFGNPRRFARIARRVAQQKPVIAVKSGRSSAGARAAASHTGSMVAQDIAVDALFKQAGVIRTDTLEEMFEVAALAAFQPMPTSRKVAILTNGGGLGILCADACEAGGLEVAELTENTKEHLEKMLPSDASWGNPVDMIASASAEQYGKALRILAADPGVDSVIVLFIPPLVTKPDDVAEAIVGAAVDCPDVTLLACFMDDGGMQQKLHGPGVDIPAYTFPESAARSLSKLAEYAEWRARDRGTVPNFAGVDRVKGVEMGSLKIDLGERWLRPEEVDEILDVYGIPTPEFRTATTPEEAASAAKGIGGTVVLKLVSDTLVHKSDVGGVVLGLTEPEQVAQAARDMIRRLEEEGLDPAAGFLVQEQSQGTEMFVGSTLDPSFGPLVACGAGGTLVELIHDVAVRITPLTDLDAKEMLRELKSWPLFEGYRGQPPLDADALEDLLLRVGLLVEDMPQVAELDLNPVLVSELGAVVVDARIRVAPVRRAAPRGSRS
jgi:acetate---CoA ligase (ADP-forming)